MLKECPHCHRHTLPRWRDSATCSNCGTRVVRANRLLGALLVALPPYITITSISRYWDNPPPPNWLVGTLLTLASVIGVVLAIVVPRYKEVKAKADTPPAHMDR
jgi:hypothetical protein